MMFELISNYDKEIYRKETNRFRSRLVGEIVLHKIFIRMSFSYLAYVGILTSALRVWNQIFFGISFGTRQHKINSK